MAHRACTNCGAPLPAAPTLTVCEFCGVEIAAPPPPPQAPPPPLVVHQFHPPPYRAVRSAGSPMASVIVGVSVAMMAVVGVVVSLVARRSASSYAPPNITIPRDPGATPGADKPRVALSALHTTPLDWTTEVAIDQSEMVGTLARFDALANWDWALRVGHAWWEDAQMFQLAIDPVEKDGTANLGAEHARVDYHLVSLACRKDQKKRAETEKGIKEASCSLELTIDKDGPSVRLDLIAVDNGGRSHALAKPACTIAQVFDQLETSKRLTKRPTYSIRLDHDVFGLNYTVRNGSGAASMDGLDVSPGFCGAKAPLPRATAATTSASTTSTSLGEIDRAAVTKALRSADLASCKAKAGPTGTGRATLTFAPNGTVTKVTVAPPYEGTEKGSCVQTAYGAVRVPPFGGSATSVSAAFSFIP